MKQLTKLLLLGLVFFAVIFGASQILLDDTDDLAACGNALLLCEYAGDPCDGIDECHCEGGPWVFYCELGAAEDW